ncbi:ATP-binding cassette domain-containing protein [Pyrodictium abyssi]|uniref:ATP-binding cassette domain-containing protein n=1 Tax=Pyrodictium abyssi TaxID=54256 RepID=UPI0030C7833D
MCVSVEGEVWARGRLLYRVEGLDLPCRGVAALIGSNGSGKSTLLRALAGLAGGVAGRAWARRPIAYMPEDSFSPPGARVADWLRLNGVDPRVAEGLLPRRYLYSRIRGLSRGWRRFVELLGVLGNEASVYLLDEPFSGMDPERVGTAGALVRGVAERSLVVVTGQSLAAIAEALSPDQVLILRGGRLERAERVEAHGVHG